MLFRMITPRISKSRSTIVRKGIPKDVRADYRAKSRRSAPHGGARDSR